MVLQATIDMLVGMKMTAMAAELASQIHRTPHSINSVFRTGWGCW